MPLDEQAEATWEQGMVNKLLFLSDRLYAQLEEEETREYELGRVTEILGLTQEVCECACVLRWSVRVCWWGGKVLGLTQEVCVCVAMECVYVGADTGGVCACVC